jgi:outer membrane protein TolC
MRTTEPLSRRWCTGAALSAAALLAGCATPSLDRGTGPTLDIVRQHAGPAAQALQSQRSDDERARANQRVAELLAAPLTADAAVEVALLNHRGLQARLSDLGVADADLAQLGRLPNPGFSFGRTRRGDEREIERGLHLSLGSLLLMPLAKEAEARRLDVMQQQAALAVLAHVAEVKKAQVRAVSAAQTRQYMQQVMEAANASAELARRMAEAGNFNRLQRAREHGFFAEAALNLARAQQAEIAARERLNRLLGLWGEQLRYSLPERLPDLPAADAQGAEAPTLERDALESRLDLRAERVQLEALARNLGLTRRTGFVNAVQLNLSRNGSNEAPPQTGWELEFQLPLFDWGEARVARAEALYMAQAHRLAQRAVDARSEVREAWHAQRTAWDIARHYRDEIVPAAQRISAENQLRYNGMFIGVFDLLADARSQVMAVNESINALRDYWLAQADLDMAHLGQPALDTAAAPASAMPAGGGGGH